MTTKIALSSLFLLALPACSWPQHEATRSVAFEAPAAALERLECTSHNGGIEVIGDPAATAVSVRVVLSVRGHTPEEAESNLRLLEVDQKTDGGALRLGGLWPRAQLDRCSPSFAFTITAPARLAVALVTHNGNLRLDGVDGATEGTTHNGDVVWKGKARQLSLTTHNGNVQADFAGDGEARAAIATHNGDVVVGFPGAVDAAFTARTHNGTLTTGSRLAESSLSRGSLTGKVGSGTGRIEVATHNGDVRVR